MPEAARVGDEAFHSRAQSGALAGAAKGALVGAVLGAAMIGLTVATGGTAAVLLGAALVAGGSTLSLAGKGFFAGKQQGQRISGAPAGPILTGSPNVLINGRRQVKDSSTILGTVIFAIVHLVCSGT